MTPAQEKYAKQLRRFIMIEAKGMGFDDDDAHELFREWNYGDSLRKLTIDELNSLLSQLRMARNRRGRGRDIPTKPSRPLKEVKSTSASAPGMATEKQIEYAGVLARRYAKLRGIPEEQAFVRWHAFVHKYQKIDHIRFCTKAKATKVLAVMERCFITTFGNDEFHALTGHTWMYRGDTYTKYNNKRPQAQGG